MRNSPLLRFKRAATALEYGVIAALVILVSTGAIDYFGGSLAKLFGSIGYDVFLGVTQDNPDGVLSYNPAYPTANCGGQLTGAFVSTNGVQMNSNAVCVTGSPSESSYLSSVQSAGGSLILFPPSSTVAITIPGLSGFGSKGTFTAPNGYLVGLNGGQSSGASSYAWAVAPYSNTTGFSSADLSNMSAACQSISGSFEVQGGNATGSAYCVGPTYPANIVSLFPGT